MTEYTEFVRRLVASMYRRANATDRADMEQEAMLCLLQTRPDASRVYATILNAAACAYRRTHGRIVTLATLDAIDPASMFPMQSSDAADALAHLEPREADVIRRRVEERQTIAEIGDSLGVSIETVRRVFNRAKQKLRSLGFDDWTGCIAARATRRTQSKQRRVKQGV